MVRLHTGEPSIYGAIGEQMDALDRLGIEYEVVPGISAFQAAAAALRVELTAPEIAQTVILTRVPGRTPMPPDEELARLARSRATLCIFLSDGTNSPRRRRRSSSTTAADCPAALVYHASWPDEKIVRGTAGRHRRPDRRRGNRQDGDFPRRLGVAPSAAARLPALRQDVRPRLSSGGRSVKIALISLSGAGADRRAHRRGLAPLAPWAGDDPCELFLHADATGLPEATRFQSIVELTREVFPRFHGLVYIAPVGLVVRAVAPCLRHKTTDPGVVVVDVGGRWAVSLLGGHEGGANELAFAVANILGAEPVVTTSTEAAKDLIVGVGCRRGAEADAIVAAVEEALAAGRLRTGPRANAGLGRHQGRRSRAC